MERQTTKQMIEDLQGQLAGLTDIVRDIVQFKAETEAPTAPEPTVNRLTPMDLFARADMRAVAYAIAEIGDKPIDTVLTASGYNRMERIVYEIACTQHDEYVITDKQVQILFDRLNKEKYFPVSDHIKAVAKAHKETVAEQMRVWTKKREAARRAKQPAKA